jgi:hypothetical protein
MLAHGVYSFEHYDKGVFVRLGGEIVQARIGGKDVGVYAARIPGVPGRDEFTGAIPIFFNENEPTVADFLLPCFEVEMTSAEIADDRLEGYFGFEARRPADGATPKAVTRQDGTGLSGYDSYQMDSAPHPYSLSYDIRCKARKRRHAQAMWSWLQKCFPRNMAFMHVENSLGELQAFTVFFEGTSIVGDLVDVVERTAAYQIAIRVEADIHLFGEWEGPSVWGGVVTEVSQLAAA